MSKPLVVYFSRTGYTRRLAEEIGRRAGAEVEAIEDVTRRSGPLGYVRSAWEALTKRQARIRPPAHDPSEYGPIILGTPVWAGSIPSPVRAYLAAQAPKCGQVAFFCTQGGSGGEKVHAAMAQLCERTPLATLIVSDGEIDRNAFEDKIDRFLESLTAARSSA